MEKCTLSFRPASFLSLLHGEVLMLTEVSAEEHFLHRGAHRPLLQALATRSMFFCVCSFYIWILIKLVLTFDLTWMFECWITSVEQQVRTWTESKVVSLFVCTPVWPEKPEHLYIVMCKSLEPPSFFFFQYVASKESDFLGFLLKRP